jgi:predicted nucleotidyltransferase component of viral defense system
MYQPESIDQALNVLNIKLAREGISIELTVLSSMALYYHGISGTHLTGDIDFYENKLPARVEELFLEVAKELGLVSDWINNRSSTLSPLPNGYESRLKKINTFSHVNLQLLSTEDLVKLKIYAYYSRMANKDMEDLKLLNPSVELIDAGIKFIEFQITHHHGSEELKRHLKDIKKFSEHVYAEFRKV